MIGTGPLPLTATGVALTSVGGGLPLRDNREYVLGMAEDPTDTSSGSAAPHGTDKARAGEEKGHDVMKAETGRYEIEGSAITFVGDPQDRAVQSSASAVGSLSVASTLASATGHVDLAAAADALRTGFGNVIIVAGDHNIIHQQQHIDIDIAQHYTEIQNQIQQLEATATTAGVDFFDCKEQHNKRLAEAKTVWAKIEAGGLYTGCIIAMLAKAASALRP